jgi:hypothetical protein
MVCLPNIFETIRHGIDITGYITDNKFAFEVCSQIEVNVPFVLTKIFIHLHFTSLLQVLSFMINIIQFPIQQAIPVKVFVFLRN